MGKKILYVCDKCTHEDAEGSEFFNIKVELKPPYPNLNPNIFYQTKMYCKDCLTKMGFVIKRDSSNSYKIKIETKPTLEDLIKNLIQEQLHYTFQQQINANERY